MISLFRHSSFPRTSTVLTLTRAALVLTGQLAAEDIAQLYLQLAAMHDSAGEHASARIIMDEYHRTRAPLCGQVLAKVQSLLRRDQQRATEAASPSASATAAPVSTTPPPHSLWATPIVMSAFHHAYDGRHQQGAFQVWLARCLLSVYITAHKRLALHVRVILVRAQLLMPSTPRLSSNRTTKICSAIARRSACLPATSSRPVPIRRCIIVCSRSSRTRCTGNSLQPLQPSRLLLFVRLRTLHSARRLPLSPRSTRRAS